MFSSCCSDFVFAVTVIYIQKSPFPTTPPGSGCALLFLVADEFTGAAGEATPPSGGTEHGQGITAGRSWVPGKQPWGGQCV